MLISNTLGRYYDHVMLGYPQGKMKQLLTFTSSPRHTIAASALIALALGSTYYINNHFRAEQSIIIEHEATEAISVSTMFAAGLANSTDNSLSIIDLSLNDITAFINNIPGGPSSWLHWRAHDGYEFLRARHQSVNLPQMRGFSLLAVQVFFCKFAQKTT